VQAKVFVGKTSFITLTIKAFAFTVLMVTDAVHGYVFSVEKEAAVRIEPNRKTRPVFFLSSQLLRVSANEA
jgi:hypothetical protein